MWTVVFTFSEFTLKLEESPANNKVHSSSISSTSTAAQNPCHNSILSKRSLSVTVTVADIFDFFHET